VHFDRAFAWKSKGDVDRAIADFDEAIRIDPKYADAFFERGRTFADNKHDRDRAIADFTEALRLNPRLAAALRYRGDEYRRKGDYDHALADHNEALRIAPNYAGVYFDRAFTWKSKGDIDRAIADFGEAIRIDPKYADAYFQRARIWNDNKHDYDRAIADNTEAIRLSPRLAAAFDNRGIAYRVKGDPDHALADFNEAIRLDPNLAYAYYQRGLVWRGKGDADRAIADFSDAIRLDPKSADNLYQRGLTSENNKHDLDRALADYDAAIRLDPKFLPPFNNRGLLYERRGSLDRALADFQAVLAADPKSASAAERIKRVEQKLAMLAQPASAPKTVPAPTTVPAPAPAAPETRVALVIGNGNYVNKGRLPNPKNDADKFAATLKRIGFSIVTLQLDLPRDKFYEALKSFAAAADRADWAVVYYAGHGMEFNGVNYLVPVDAKLANDRDISYEAVALEQVLLAVEGAHKLRLVILDACRDNPFLKTMVKTNASRSVGQGLAKVEPEGATLVAYAAKEGHVAWDGEGGNSPFVSAIIRNIEIPGVEINFLFRKVRDEVLKATGGHQEPYVYGSLPAEAFYFRRP
jgi:tetratricopeptide (TPR) repeat protein